MQLVNITPTTLQPPEFVGGFLVVNECERCHHDFECLSFCGSCDSWLCNECFAVHLKQNVMCACEAAD